MKKYEVVAFSYTEIEDIEKELNMRCYFNYGCVNFSMITQKNLCYSEREKIFLDHLRKKHCLAIPDNAKIFCSDGAQDFDFTVGIMYEKN